jgi:hypothetical protein
LVKWHNCFCVWTLAVILYQCQKMVFQMLSSWWISLYHQSLNREEMWKNGRHSKSLTIWFWGWKLYNDHAYLLFLVLKVMCELLILCMVLLWFILDFCLALECDVWICWFKERKQAINEMKLSKQIFLLSCMYFDDCCSTLYVSKM